MRKLLLLLALICMFIPASSARAAGAPLSIYYAGPDGGVRTALGLDKECVLPRILPRRIFSF